jgi:predicted transcriptional regulator
MTTRENAKKRSIFLKGLREQHKESVERTQLLLKEQKAIRKVICQPIRAEAKTVPEIAGLTGIPADQILWHITAMRKYGLVVESGMQGEYYLYQHV